MITVRIEHKAPPLCFNGVSKSSYYAMAREVKYWREAIGWEAKAKRIKPLIAPVAITIHHYRAKPHPRVDTGAVALAQKGAVDGLVDAKVLPGDGPEIVIRLTYLAPEVVGYHGLAIEVTELGDTA